MGINRPVMGSSTDKKYIRHPDYSKYLTLKRQASVIDISRAVTRRQVTCPTVTRQ